MKKNNLPGKCQKRFTAIFVSVMIFSLISGTVSATETEMTKQSTESETQTSEAEPFQSSTELPVEEETEAPVETPTEAITGLHFSAGQSCSLCQYEEVIFLNKATCYELLFPYCLSTLLQIFPVDDTSDCFLLYSSAWIAAS